MEWGAPGAGLVDEPVFGDGGGADLGLGAAAFDELVVGVGVGFLEFLHPITGGIEDVGEFLGVVVHELRGLEGEGGGDVAIMPAVIGLDLVLFEAGNGGLEEDFLGLEWNGLVVAVDELLSLVGASEDFLGEVGTFEIAVGSETVGGDFGAHEFQAVVAGEPGGGEEGMGAVEFRKFFIVAVGESLGVFLEDFGGGCGEVGESFRIAIFANEAAGEEVTEIGDVARGEGVGDGLEVAIVPGVV